MAHAPFYLIQGAGRPSAAAAAHVVELPLYLALTRILIERLGIVGGALTWSIRVAVDPAVMFPLARGAVGAHARAPGPRLAAFVLVGVAALVAAVPLAHSPLGARVVYILTAVSPLMVAYWRLLMDDAERQRVLELRRAGPRRLLARE